MTDDKKLAALFGDLHTTVSANRSAADLTREDLLDGLEEICRLKPPEELPTYVASKKTHDLLEAALSKGPTPTTFGPGLFSGITLHVNNAIPDGEVWAIPTPAPGEEIRLDQLVRIIAKIAATDDEEDA